MPNNQPSIEDNDALLTYRVGPVLCCGPTLPIITITPPPKLTHPPGTNVAEPGIFKHGPYIVSATDLRYRFGVKQESWNQPGQVIIVKQDEQARGFFVDEIKDVIRFPQTGWGQLPVCLPRGIFSRTLLLNNQIHLYSDFDKLAKLQGSGYLKEYIEQLEQVEEIKNDESKQPAITNKFSTRTNTSIKKAGDKETVATTNSKSASPDKVTSVTSRSTTKAPDNKMPDEKIPGNKIPAKKIPSKNAPIEKNNSDLSRHNSDKHDGYTDRYADCYADHYIGSTNTKHDSKSTIVPSILPDNKIPSNDMAPNPVSNEDKEHQSTSNTFTTENKPEKIATFQQEKKGARRDNKTSIIRSDKETAYKENILNDKLQKTGITHTTKKNTTPIGDTANNKRSEKITTTANKRPLTARKISAQTNAINKTPSPIPPVTERKKSTSIYKNKKPSHENTETKSFGAGWFVFILLLLLVTGGGYYYINYLQPQEVINVTKNEGSASPENTNPEYLGPKSINPENLNKEQAIDSEQVETEKEETGKVETGKNAEPALTENFNSNRAPENKKPVVTTQESVITGSSSTSINTDNTTEDAYHANIRHENDTITIELDGPLPPEVNTAENTDANSVNNADLKTSPINKTAEINDAGETSANKNKSKDIKQDTNQAANTEDRETQQQSEPVENKTLKPGYVEIVHIIIKGDTLWAIAKRYLKNPFRYPELAKLSNIKNPDLIYPGNKVIITYRKQ